MNRPFVVFAVFAVLCVFARGLYAADWNQWRGPSRDGIVPAASVPAEWPKSFKKVWRVEVGEGYSSPVVAGDRVFLHTRRDPEEIVQALDLATGKIRWERKYSAPFQKNQYATKMMKGPNSTPLALGGRLYTLGVTGILNAWDTATGNPVWNKDFSVSVDSSKLFCGTSASPLAVGGQVVVQVGSDLHGGRILALNPATGAIKWEWKGPGPGYASPVVIQVADSKQVVSMTERSIVGIDSSEGRELWSIPFPDEWQENIVTPVWTGSHLVVSGTRQGTHAFTLKVSGGKWQAAPAWTNSQVAMYMSSPVVGDGLIYGHSNKKRGQFLAMDGKTGEIRWASEGRNGDHASVLLTPKHVLFLTSGADLIVARRATPTLSVERRYKLAESETWAVPALLGDDMIIRDSSGLMRLSSRN